MNRDLVSGGWKRAAQTLRAAELRAREGYHEDSVSRAYYAILPAAKAALFVRDVVAESHAAVRRLFGKHLVLSGDVERRWATYLGASMDERLAADYDTGASFTAEDARQECERARPFVERIRHYLLLSGFADAELGTTPSDG